jgi:ATP-dependent helicase/nuclease subunit B
VTILEKLQITLGRAGSGKSIGICQKIRSLVDSAPVGTPIFWIVPDEIAYTTERMLMDVLDTSLRAEVITMRRFAERIYQSVGNRDAKIINLTGKRLLLASVYQTVLPHLDALYRDKPSMAFFDTILQAFDELSSQLVDILQLEGAIEVAAASLEEPFGRKKWTPGHSLIGKLRDICLLYVHYRRIMDHEGFLDPAIFLTQVMPMVKAYAPLVNGVVFFDGFSDMTPQMTEFALCVIEQAQHAEFALSVDPAWLLDSGFQKWRESERNDGTRMGESSGIVDMMNGFRNQNAVFMPKTLLYLVDLTTRLDAGKIPYRIQTVRVENQSLQSDMNHVERNLYGDIMVHPIDCQGALQVAEAGNIHLEVTGVAREIKRLVASGTVNYDDIAVVVSSTGDYQGHIEDIFLRYQIPYNLDAFPSLAEYPLAKFLVAAFEIVREHCSVMSVVRLVKTDFCGLSQEEADWFETYIRAYEVSSPGEWFSDNVWTYAAITGDERRMPRLLEEDVRAERYRQRLIRYLLPFYEAISKAITTPLQIATAIWSLLLAVDAKATVANWMVNEDGSQNPLEASLHEQAWQYLVSLCDDLSSVAPNTQMETSDILRVLLGDIERISLSTIPATVGSTLITDFSRTHGWKSNIVFVLGLTDKAIPGRFTSTGILQDEERVAFERLFGTPLGYTSADLQLASRDNIYHLFTRARKKLVLCYPLLAPDGKEMRASIIVQRLLSLFTEHSVPCLLWHTENGLSKLSDGSFEPLVLTPEAALDLAVAHAGEVLSGQESLILAPLLEWFTKDEQGEQRLLDAMRGFLHHHDNRPLDKKLCESLYGTPLKMNVYQLESFAACPFKHFVQYGLRINADDANVVTPATKGTLLHDVLLSFVTEHMADLKSWRELSDDEAVLSMKNHFGKVMMLPKFSLWHKEAIRLQQADDLFASLSQAAIILTHHAKYGRFAPCALELSFGLPEEGSLPGFDVQLDNGSSVSIRGRIDRVDQYANESISAFRIIDYKSSQLDIDLTKVEHGLRLQLPVYAAAIERHGKSLFGKASKAAGILYFPVTRKVELKNAPLEESRAQTEVQKRMRARGFMTADREVIEAMDERLPGAVDTELFGKVYNKNETIAKYAPALPEAEWEMLIGRALAHVREIATRIMNGEVQVSPYRIGQTETACTNCPFQALCQFDPNYDAHLYRKLRKFSRSEIPSKWAKFQRGVES